MPLQVATLFFTSKSIPASVIRGDTVKLDRLSPLHAADSADVHNYLKVLKSERNNHIILSVPVLALLIAVLLTAYMPVVPFLSLVLFTFLLIILLKQRKYKKVLHDPGNHPNPKDKKRYTKDSRREQRNLMWIGIILMIPTLAVLVSATILSILGANIIYAWFLVPMGLIMLYYIISAMLGRNYNRGQKLRGLDTDMTVSAINAWNWFMISIGTLIGGLSFFYTFFD